MNRKNLLAFLVILIIGCSFGYWFAMQQLAAISAVAYLTYPAFYFYLTVAKCYLVVMAIYSANYFFLFHLSSERINTFIISLTYLPLYLVYTGVSLGTITLIIMGLQLFSIFAVFRQKDYRFIVNRYALDGLVLLIFCIAHFFLTTRYSPLHWNKALLVFDGMFTDEAFVLAPIFKGFVLAKQFSFSNVDFSQWAGLMHTPFLLNSPMLQIAALILDLPSVSYESFHIALMNIFFFLSIAGSLGFYLFLRYSAKVHIIFAVLGGLLYMFGGSSLLSMMLGNDSGAFFTSYSIFPFALLLISIAFEKMDLRYAVWAGVALASQFFIFAPHPEGVIYSGLFYGLYTLGLIFYTKTMPLGQRFKLSVVSGTVFVGLGAFDIIPILADLHAKNMYVFAHVGDITRAHISSLYYYMIILSLALGISKYLLRKEQNQLPVYLSSVFLSCCLLISMLLTTQPLLLQHLLPIGVHFWYYWRPGNYFIAMVFVIYLFAIDALSKALYTYLTKNHISSTPVSASLQAELKEHE